MSKDKEVIVRLKLTGAPAERWEAYKKAEEERTGIISSEGMSHPQFAQRLLAEYGLQHKDAIEKVRAEQEALNQAGAALDRAIKRVDKALEDD